MFEKSKTIEQKKVKKTRNQRKVKNLVEKMREPKFCEECGKPWKARRIQCAEGDCMHVLDDDRVQVSYT